ncbi:hypothetical protein [Streptomyces sp. SID5789]|uniref:hypothetical protein n=1 Tax=Streptomyces sp. SID5789 TaxID=2690310 RepID=UPI001F3C0863|nr:hypothetical protein [Streptomyces sp. SID5789]
MPDVTRNPGDTPDPKATPLPKASPVSKGTPVSEGAPGVPAPEATPEATPEARPEARPAPKTGTQPKEAPVTAVTPVTPATPAAPAHPDAAVAPEARTTPTTPTTPAHDAAGPLLPHGEGDKLGQRLHHAVAGFVDAPRASVEEADRVLEELAARLADAVTHRHRTLRTSWQDSGEDGRAPSTDTEQLRLALRDYRELADRLMRL